MLTDLRSRTAVVTGSTRGIGQALALALARRGMNVVVSGTDLTAATSVADEIRALGVGASAVVCDVTDREAVRGLAQRAVDEYGAVDVLCNNAGGSTFGPFLEHSDADWDWMIDLGLRGVVHGIQAFLPLMAARGTGHILNTGSMMGLVPDWVDDHGPYSAAKAAVIALTMSLRREAARHNVGVSVLIPAGVTTEPLRSRRSRPDRYGGPLDEAYPLPNIREGAPEPLPGTQFMLTPDEVGEIAVTGIMLDDPIIITHPGLKPTVQEYSNRFVEACDRWADRLGRL